MACRRPLSEPILDIVNWSFRNTFQWHLKPKFKHFRSRKCIWKCRLKNGGQFVSASLCYSLFTHWCHFALYYMVIFGSVFEKSISKMSTILYPPSCVNKLKNYWTGYGSSFGYKSNSFRCLSHSWDQCVLNRLWHCSGMMIMVSTLFRKLATSRSNRYLVM